MTTSTPFRKTRRIQIFLAFILVAATIPGCAGFLKGIDIITDPDVLDVIDSLLDLVEKYSVALRDPLLEVTDRAELENRCAELCAAAHDELDRLALLGYHEQVAGWRKELSHKWQSSSTAL